MKTILLLILLSLTACKKKPEYSTLRWKNDTNAASWSVYVDGVLHTIVHTPEVKLPKNKNMDIVVIATSYQGVASMPAYILIRSNEVITLTNRNESTNNNP